MNQHWKKHILIALGTVMTIFTGMATNPTPSITEQQNFDYYFYDAERALQAGKMDEGMALLQHCLTLQPNNAAVNHLIGAIYASIDSTQIAFPYIAKAVQHDPEAWMYVESYISLLADMEDYDEILRVVKNSLKHDPKNIEAWQIKALGEVQKGQYQKAIKTYNQIEKIQGITDMSSIEKFKLYMACDKEKKAVNEIDRLVNEYPTEYRFQVLRGQLYMGQQMYEKAYETYQHVLSKNPENPYIYISLAEYYKQKGEPQKASELIITALQSKYLDVNTKLNIYKQYHNSLTNLETKKEELENMLKGLCEQYPFEEEVHLYYGMFLLENNKQDSAIHQWKNALEINPKNKTLWLQILHMQAASKDTLNQATILLKEAEAAHNALPDEAIFLYYKVFAQTALRLDSAALNTCEQAIQLCKPDEWALQGEFWAFKGNIYHSLGDMKATVESYAIAAKLLPDNMMILNNYAYFLALNGTDLKTAERISQRTINKEPENSIYLDTYAWILHLQGYNSLAKFYIERAINNIEDPNSALTYYEHYGYIMLENQQEEKAMNAWKKAVELGTNDTYIIETIQRLNNEHHQP